MLTEEKCNMFMQMFWMVQRLRGGQWRQRLAIGRPIRNVLEEKMEGKGQIAET